MRTDNHDAELDSAADGLRRLTDLLLRVDADDEGLAAAADELDQITAMLGVPADRSDGNDPVSGRANAIAPPLEVAVDDVGTVLATGILGLPFQGPKGLVHGGMSALMLDHVLGMAGAVDGAPAVVEELSVRYHRPTPLFTELHISAARTDPSGRQVQGAIVADGVTTVSAEARLAPPPH